MELVQSVSMVLDPLLRGGSKYGKLYKLLYSHAHKMRMGFTQHILFLERVLKEWED